MEEIAYGYCHCGCGQKTSVIKYPSDGIVGTPHRFVKDHKAAGKKHPGWKGGKSQEPNNGYIILNPNVEGRYVREHQIVAEQIYGGPLPKGYEVHHKNGKRADNDPDNIIICKNKAEHRKIHADAIALQECSHAEWRKCRYCHKYDDLANMHIKGNTHYHKECNRKAQQDYRNKCKAQGRPITHKTYHKNIKET